MKYLLLIHGDESKMNAATVADETGMSPDYHAYNSAMAKAGILVGGERLRPTAEAASVRVNDDGTQVLDGPYAETREQLGGYYMIDVPDIDEAIQWAARCPAARHGTIEVRPIWPISRRIVG
ncbi:YciI family protein [Devosia algicola]|uniref:YciI family protein n=2 Tax=Devosia algicola TaxID=3026418 RepID=A0ABY7YSK0_9HYPH|nr:YciI family protein [Devosia algicola]